MPLWTKGGALEIDIKEQTDTTFTFNVTRCRYAETYKAMGLGEIGALLSCNRDGAFCEGYDPKLKLERSQTIMGGASHCDFKFGCTNRIRKKVFPKPSATKLWLICNRH